MIMIGVCHHSYMVAAKSLFAVTITVLIAGCTQSVDGSAQVSSGVVPDVRGMQENAAHLVLSDAGPWPYVLRSKPSETVPSGYVLSIGPVPGTVLPLNEIVDVVVSRGPE